MKKKNVIEEPEIEVTEEIIEEEDEIDTVDDSEEMDSGDIEKPKTNIKLLVIITAIVVVIACALCLLFFTPAKNIFMGNKAAEIDVSEMITLGDIDLTNVPVDDTSYTEDDILTYIMDVLNTYGTVVAMTDDATTEEGMYVTIAASVNDGDEQEYTYLLGTDELWDGLTANTTGLHNGDTFTFTSGDDNISGTVVSAETRYYFDIDNLTEDFVKDNFGVDTVAEFYTLMKQQFIEAREDETNYLRKHAVLNQIIASSDVNIPDSAIDTEVNIYIKQFENMYCIDTSLEDYLSENYDISIDDFRNIVYSEVAASYKNVVVCMALAEKYNITLEDNDLTKYLEGVAKNTSYSASDRDKLYELYTTPYMDGETYLKRMALCNKVADFLVEQANFKVE